MNDLVGEAPSIGVEEEYQILCPETLALLPAYDRLAERASGSALTLKTELHQACCEVVTPPCRSVAELDDAVRRQRRALIAVARSAGLRIGLAGTHPFSHWSELPITREPRRLQSEHLFQEAHRQCLAFALHLHVGVPDRAIALRVMNDSRPLLPVLYALSASSPFLEGRRTGLCSSRLLRAFGFPRTGIPDEFENLEVLDDFTATLQRAGLIADAGQLWWDIRIHHIHPTVEFRICDAVPFVDDVTALAALVQAYVARLLDRYRRGGSAETVNRLLVEENRWRAARFGCSAELLDHPSNRLETLAGITGRIGEEVDAFATAFGTTRYLRRVQEIATTGSSADRQLHAWEDGNGDFTKPVECYLAETEADGS